MDWLEKWLTALRSGKYKQGKNFLFDKHHCTYCCLGVLCEVGPIPTIRLGTKEAAEYDKKDDHPYLNGFFFTDKPEDDRWSETYVPKDLAATLGICSNAQFVLALLNDSKVSFEDIAALIERHKDILNNENPWEKLMRENMTSDPNNLENIDKFLASVA